MVFVQFVCNASAQYSGGSYSNNPVLIRVPLYGKYRTRIISIQYYGAENTLLQIRSRQLLMPIVGTDNYSSSLNSQSFASRYPNVLIGTDNSSNQPVIGTAPWEFTTDWDGVFEYVLYDVQNARVLSLAPGAFTLLINMDVLPVESSVEQPFNPTITNTTHMFTQMPVRTYEK